MVDNRSSMIKGIKRCLTAHPPGLNSDDGLVGLGNLELLFSNYVSQRQCPFLQLAGKGG